MIHLSSLLGNSQKLDGGAMFGNIPKALWSKWYTPDETNRIQLACRALLVQTENANILLETGIGNFFNPVLKERYGVVEDEAVLLNSLQQHGLSHEDIDYVILSHLHFDHAGGLLRAGSDSADYELLFPKAKYIVGQEAWQRARQPHYRDKASFIPELIALLKQSERLVIIQDEHCNLLGKEFKFIYSHGHTPGMMLTEIRMPSGPVVFAADLIPGKEWVHLPITMGYDRYPEILIDEKKKLLDYLTQNNGRLFYTHDPKIALSNIKQDEKGKYTSYNELTILDKFAN